MIARGRARCRSLTSSPAVATASRPMKEKKIVPAAAVIPPLPEPMKLLKWSPCHAVNAITEKMSSTPSLMRTMIVLTRADSVAPRSSRSMHRRTRTTAGRLMSPPVATPSGPGRKVEESASGSRRPSVACSSSLK